MGKRPKNQSVTRDLTYTERREKAARLYLSGHTQAETADILGVDQSTVSRDLQAIREVWLEAAVQTFDQIKAQELARIDRLEREYWKAWERSQQDVKVLRQKGRIIDENEKMKTAEAIQVVTSQIGDKSFLEGVQWCIEQRLKIFGIYAAVKVDATWREAAPKGIDVVFERDVEGMIALLTSGNDSSQ